MFSEDEGSSEENENDEGSDKDNDAEVFVCENQKLAIRRFRTIVSILLVFYQLIVSNLVK